jgi:2,5-diketo-D-gluconate reductase A
MTLAPTVKLNGGVEMPHIGLGTWPMKSAEVDSVVNEAIGLGYRLIDTAYNYGNEIGVGVGIRRNGIAREELFVTTKVPGRHHGYKETLASLDESLEHLQLDYVDLYLIHWPNPITDKYVDTWKAFIDLQNDGKVRAIGVSNFKSHQIERLILETGVAPAVNQVQLYPAITQTALRDYNEQHGIVTESWSPLGLGANAVYFSGHKSFLDQPVIKSIADAHRKSTAQVILRWHIQLGLVPLPKSSNAKRLAENIDVFSFKLTNDEMAQLSALDDGSAEVADSDTYEEF